MDDFKTFLDGKRKPQRKQKKTTQIQESLKDETPRKISSKTELNSTIIAAQKILSEDASIQIFQDMPRSGFIGAFNYVPEPSMFNEGSEYRNKNNGTVYKKVGNLWEEYVRDGKNGAQGMSVGGGCGVAEVNQIFNSKIIVSSAAPTGDVIPGTIWIVV